MDAIAAFDMTKTYTESGGAVAALQNINLQIPEGRAMACVGRECSGKTTLIRLLAGMERPTFGECSVLGLSPSRETARLHSMVGTVLHSARLYRSLTLRENLMFFAGIHGLPDAVERISFLMHRLHIWEDVDKKPSELPTGVLTRAGLARALLHRPRVLLMDEQGAGMDRESGLRVRELVEYAIREEGVTLLYCTQNMNYAQELCHNFGLLDRGRLIARGNMESLRVGGGVRMKASLRMGQGQKAPAGFTLRDGLWQKEIASDEDMPQLISQAVSGGGSLYEARVIRPTLEEIYAAYLNGSRGREVLLHGETKTAEPSQPIQSTQPIQPAQPADAAPEAQA